MRMRTAHPAGVKHGPMANAPILTSESAEIVMIVRDETRGKQARPDRRGRHRKDPGTRYDSPYAR